LLTYFEGQPIYNVRYSLNPFSRSNPVVVGETHDGARPPGAGGILRQYCPSILPDLRSDLRPPAQYLPGKVITTSTG